jgi:16S rRNA (uracil1498-N3)-methyltransferase
MATRSIAAEIRADKSHRSAPLAPSRAAMPRYDFSSRRLFVDAPLAAGGRVDLGRDQAHYLRDVLRLGEGATLLVFNGRDGEWSAEVAAVPRKGASLLIRDRTRAQEAGPDLHYLFAPLKHARLDYMVQKAVEMGARRLAPVITRHTQVMRVNGDRMRANAIEAAEQCGILALPQIAEPAPFEAVVADWPAERLMVFCDEEAEVRDPVRALIEAGGCAPGTQPSLALIVGPEGGFDRRERDALLALPRVVRLSLGPRILRADTAAVAGLALVQAVLGDARHSDAAAALTNRNGL